MLLQALAERQIGRRDQAARWLWRLAEYSREVHEEYAVQRWPETKRLLGPAGELVGRGARAQRAPAGAGGAQAGPPAVGRAAGGRAGAHAGGPAGAGRRPHAHGPQAVRAGPRAAPELPEGQAPPRRPPPEEEGRGGDGERAARRANGDGEGERRREDRTAAPERRGRPEAGRGERPAARGDGGDDSGDRPAPTPRTSSDGRTRTPTHATRRGRRRRRCRPDGARTMPPHAARRAT